MQTNDIVRRELTVRRVDGAEAAPRVRHVDQLSDAALERFTDALEGEPSTPPRDRGAVADGGDAPGSSFVDGEVIVFTNYYRIELR